jgi:ribosome-binding protein aMBF1 (putative translation factor)
MDLNPQMFRTPDGAEMVIITKAEYDFLAARVEEDDDEAAVFDERMAEVAAGKAPALPVEVTALMLRGDSLLKALRKWRDLSQFDLVGRTSLAQGYISDLESGKRKGTPETMRRLAAALEIDPAWLEATP